MEVSELIVLDGTFNGYERDIVYQSSYTNYNASNIENLSVSAKHVNKVSFETFYEYFEATPYNQHVVLFVPLYFFLHESHLDNKYLSHEVIV